MSHRIRREDCTIGWICSLPVEFAAARVMLDKEHEGDGISYALGPIGDMRVAILRLDPSNDIGAIVAYTITSVYTGFRFLLMVGVGSGVPSSNIDIRLGDVVVAHPPTELVHFEVKDGKPNVNDSTVESYIPLSVSDRLDESMHVLASNSTELSRLASKINGIAGFPQVDIGDDILFPAAYDHEGGETCDWCSADRKKRRRPRRDPTFKVYFGRIAYGDQIVRDGRTRDHWSAELDDILCFETERTDVLASFPSLVLRGICDYADSHTNEKWRPYAATNAAASARLVLLDLLPATVVSCVSMTLMCDSYLADWESTPMYKSRYAARSDDKSVSTSTLFSKGQHLEITDSSALSFRTIKPLGKGGSAVVNMVEDGATGRKFAHKIFGTFYGKTAYEKAKQSFQNEIDIMKRLSSNPHIIEVFATYTHGRELGMLLIPVASHGSLADYLDKITDSGVGPTIDQEIILRHSFGCLASGLAYIHEQTIRHKDIKPQNILIHYGRIIYADFGIALDGRQQGTTTVGRPGGFTQRYCAPEVAEWGRRNRKSDIFSLGCVFVEVLAALTSNRVPSADDPDPYWKRVKSLGKALRRSQREVCLRALHERRHSGGYAPPDSRLFDICLWMTESEQEDRCTAADVVQDIAAIEIDPDWTFHTAHLRHLKQPYFAGMSTGVAISKALRELPNGEKSGLAFLGVFSVPDCDGYILIGITEAVNSAIWHGERRPTLVYGTRTVFAFRTMLLIEAELKDVHYIYRNRFESCGAWFLTTLDHGARVLNKYSEWMVTRPYVFKKTTRRWMLDPEITEQEIEDLCRPVIP